MIMKLAIHNLKPAARSKHQKKRIGRGNASGHGTSSTRGGKGQTARAGGSHRLRLKAFKRLMQSTPKLRGFKSLKNKSAEIFVESLEKNFDNGSIINLASLKEKGLVGADEKSAKIILKGSLKKKIIVEGIACSKSAKAEIEKAGGEVK